MSADPSPVHTGSDDSNCEKGTSGVMMFAVRSSFDVATQGSQGRLAEKAAVLR